MRQIITAPTAGISLSLRTLLREAAELDPMREAVTAPDRAGLPYRQLDERIEHLTQQLHALGFAPGDRVAYALPDGPDTAVLAMGVMCAATASPINPSLPQDECERQLHNLGARALVIPFEADGAARRAAAKLGIETIELRPDPDAPAGNFELVPSRPMRTTTARRRSGTGADHAPVVQTSGTTGAAKVVALSHDNLLSMMLANRDVLRLSPDDRCLGIMPLFHIHGLGAVICTLLGGGGVMVAPRFAPQAFFAWLAEYRPTWYTAVPTIHQSILTRAADHPSIVADIVRTRMLRFVRSGSAPMPRGVPEQIERTFATEYIEASGATECSAYICSNRPGRRRIGSVGLPLPGNEVQIAGADGTPLPAGSEGELVVRGPGVFAGYEDRSLNAAAFRDGYFRTGDLARRDADGFVYLTGRLKEQINRAGMKVSPREVDEALLQHPGVAEAATFAVPDPRVGDEIAAVIVGRSGHRLSILDLQRHVAQRLADYKVPRQIVFLDTIPKNATGKIVRLNLAQQVGLLEMPAALGRMAELGTPLTAQPTASPIASPTQLAVAAIWSKVLQEPVTDFDVEFHYAGGDSMAAMQLTLELEHRFGRPFPVATVSTHSTIRRLAELIDEDDAARPAALPAAPVILHSGSATKPMLFCLPGVGGNVFCYSAIADRVDGDRTVVGLPLPGTDGLEPPLDSIDAIARRFTVSIRALQPHGPYHLLGYSFGGRIATEVARRLLDAGERVERLMLIDTAGPNWPGPLPPMRRFVHRLRTALGNPRGAMRRVADGLRGIKPRPRRIAPEAILRQLRLDQAPPERQQLQLRLVEAAERAVAAWQPTPLDTEITVFRAAVPVWEHCDVSDRTMGWSAVSTRPVAVLDIPGSHGTVFHEPHVSSLVRHVRRLLLSVD